MAESIEEIKELLNSVTDASRKMGLNIDTKKIKSISRPTRAKWRTDREPEISNTCCALL